jgi:hypothetical protein
MVLGPPPLAEGSLAQSGRDVRLWPDHTFELTSPLSKKAALEALAACTEPERGFASIGLPNRRNDLRFHGAIEGDTFRIRRIMGYTNMFAPLTTGAIETNGAGSRITIRMDARRDFAFTLGIWSAFILIVFFNVLAPAIILFIAPAYVLAISMYGYEADLQRRSLRRIFHVRVG